MANRVFGALMDLGLEDQVVVVTGGSSGVGLATVRLLVAEGALVATCARDGDRLDASLAATDVDVDRVLAQGCDVRDAEAVGDFVENTGRRFGRIDGLVNNAGSSRMAGLHELTAADWRDELELKFAGVLNPTLACLPSLRKAPAAGVVNVNAVLAVQPDPRLLATSAARAGVLNLSRGLAEELAIDGVRVNTVCLGLIDTGQWRRRHEAIDPTIDYDEWQAGLARDRRIPLGRLGRAEEVANAVAFLVSPRSSYVTGAVLDVSGGINRSIH